jgi:Fe-S-cluster-containing hydrogenase component 2
VKILRANRMERCIGCYSCSLACARLVHKSLSWQRAGIRIHSAGGLSAGYEARVCVACDPAPCVAACPTDALRQRKGGGARVSLSKCVHCGACGPACPVNAIYMDIETDEPVLCYHCGKCVAFCPHDCLEMVSPERFEGDDDQDDE